MHNIKKSIRKNIALAAVMLMAVFTLAACGKKYDGGSFGFNNGSVLLTPGEKFSADDEGMPETLQYMEAASCYFEGLDKDSIILLEQIRTIDKQRLKQYMGMMPDNIMARVDKALAISISLKGGHQNG